ncbi:MAG: hypothetical protein AAGJ31_10905, partial [Verrucomicrobiota bacterium]
WEKGSARIQFGSSLASHLGEDLTPQLPQYLSSFSSQCPAALALFPARLVHLSPGGLPFLPRSIATQSTE